jgi:hypothetical protein
MTGGCPKCDHLGQYQVARIVHEETQNSKPQRPEIRPTEEEIAALDSFLSGKTPLGISITSQTGDPGAYKAAQALIACFRKHKWEVDGGFVNFSSLDGYYIFVGDDGLRMPRNVAAACEALTASGIHVRVSVLESLEREVGFIFIAKDY